MMMFETVMGKESYSVFREGNHIVVRRKTSSSSREKVYSHSSDWKLVPWNVSNLTGYQIVHVKTDEVLFGFVGENALSEANKFMSNVFA